MAAGALNKASKLSKSKLVKSNSEKSGTEAGAVTPSEGRFWVTTVDSTGKEVSTAATGSTARVGATGSTGKVTSVGKRVSFDWIFSWVKIVSTG